MGFEDTIGKWTIVEIEKVASILHSFAPDRAFLTSDCISDKSYTRDVPPYALVADGTYQDSWNELSDWSYGIFPNDRNVLWSCKRNIRLSGKLLRRSPSSG